MRRGFLPDAADQSAVQKPTNNLASDTPNNISSVSTSEPQSVPSSSVPTADQVEEILALLKGPTDERRFVGLLLATKLLRIPDDDILRRIYEAIGLEFLDRLLLPLQLAVDAPIDALPAGDKERTARQGAEVALGLSVLAALSRLPEVAASDALAAKANLFLQVARQGGVGAALQAQHAHSMPQRTAQQQQGDAPVTPVTEAAAPVGASPSPPAPLTPALGSPAGAPPRGTASASPEGTADVQDALECALAVTGAGAAGREAMVQAGALRAALAVLQRGRAQRLAAATGGNARGQQRAQQGREAAQGGAVGDVEAVRNWLLAVRLLAVVLGGSGRGEVLAGHATEVVPLVAELARLLALPAALKRPQAAQPAAVHPGGTTFSSAAELAVQLQLEALHVLHMLLLHVAAGAGQGGGALREALSTSARHEHSAARRGGWPDAVRRGLTVILRGRVSPVERHRALQLAAAMVDLAGTEWLLGREACAAGTSSGVASGAFYQVLVEVVRIETSVLLLDALAPAERVPLAGDAARVARETGEGAAGGPGGEHEEELDGEEMLGDIAPEVLAELAEMGDETGPAAGWPADGDGSETASQAAAGGGQKGKGSQRRHEVEGQSSSADVRMLQQVLESEVEQRKLASSWKGGAGEAAGVQGGLQQPVLEAAQPAGVGEGPAPEARPRGSWETAGQRASRLLPPCFALLEECIEALALSAQAEDAEAAGEEPQGVALPPDVSLRAITSLQEVCDALLQFLEETVGGGAPGTQGAAAGVAGTQASEARAALQAAAVRVVGRFCAEVPEAFGPRLRALLPRLLPHRASQHPPCAAAAASQPPAVMEGEAARLQDSVGEEGVGLLPFLLPMLIQQVGPPAGTAGAPALAEAGEEQAAWLLLLRSEEVLPSLASNACQAAAAYTALLGQQGAASAEEDVEVAGAMLYNSVTLLLCTLRPGSAQDPAFGDSPPLPPDALTYTLPLLEQLLAIIEELLQARSSPHSLKLLGGWAALCAELAAVLLAQHVMAHHGDGYLLVEEGQQQRVAAVTLGALRQTAEAVQQLAEEPGGGEGDTGSRMLMLGDLMQNLDAVSSAALSLLHVSPTFAAICAADIWLREILGEGGLAAAVSAWEAGEGQLSEWHHLLQAVQALL